MVVPEYELSYAGQFYLSGKDSSSFLYSLENASEFLFQCVVIHEFYHFAFPDIWSQLQADGFVLYLSLFGRTPSLSEDIFHHFMQCGRFVQPFEYLFGPFGFKRRTYASFELGYLEFFVYGLERAGGFAFPNIREEDIYLISSESYFRIRVGCAYLPYEYHEVIRDLFSRLEHISRICLH